MWRITVRPVMKTAEKINVTEQEDSGKFLKELRYRERESFGCRGFLFRTKLRSMRQKCSP